MATRRDQIRMTAGELWRFADEQRTVQVATIGRNGRPHMMPLWYFVPEAGWPDGGARATAPPDGVDPDAVATSANAPVLHGWTFAKSQKAVNLRRDPHATIAIEAGTAYEELRGVTMECDVELVDDPELVAEFGIALFTRYGPGGELSDDARAAVLAQAAKRVALRFGPTKVVSWDHRKLGGVY
ncbi:MAG: pyridoxamine 5'-phosphate oxidase [Solirubrobacterales bacterium]|nr:pyridoxamine 5'-phosphate oxidase [Solirubrobacterales bacterium]